MADKKPFNFKKIIDLSKVLNNRMNDIYRQTYNSSRSTRKELNDISDRVEDNIDAIMNRNNDIDTPNITKLYSRAILNKNLNDRKVQKQIEDVFSDEGITNNLLGTYLENKNVKDLINEIDTVLKYMPKLDEALKAKRDALLSSDNFAKDFINASVSSMYDEDRIVFTSRINSMKNKYKLPEKFDSTTYFTMKYGEQFIYHAPYKKALDKLLRDKNKTISAAGPGRLHESTIDIDCTTDIKLNSPITTENYKVNLFFNYSGVLESAISEHTNLLEATNVVNEVGSVCENVNILMEDKLPNGLKDIKANKNKAKLNKTIDDELEFPKKDFDDSARDGFIDTGRVNNNSSTDIKTPGCVLKSLKPENVILLYIEDICLGYYYFEFDPTMDNNIIYNNQYDSTGYGATMFDRNAVKNSQDIRAQQDKTQLLKYVASNIANRIDAQFINTNTDLSKEIYAILKYNDLFNSANTQNIRVTFLPEEDVTHIKFEEDPDTHRGISDLLNCLLQAKMYACIKINDTIATLTRSADRRVYYVKQNTETNIAQTLMNVINQIKRSNFNLRQIENMNAILNIIGKYNDFVIPVGPSGDAPVQMEVMQGQDVQPQTELLEKLEEECVNNVGIPIELVNARFSTDFATQITMSNIKFLRHCILRQEKLEAFFSRIMSAIYNAEYGEQVYIKCVLPQPLFLSVTNLNSIIDTIRTNAETISNYEYDDENDENNTAKRVLFMKYMMRNRLATYVKEDEVENIKRQVEFEFSKRKTQPGSPQGSLEPSSDTGTEEYY